MKDYHKIMTNKVRIVIYILIGITVVFAYMGWNNALSKINDIAVWMIISIITTGVAQLILQKFTGDFFEKIPLTIKIGQFKFQVTLFIIITIILKIIIF